MTDLLARHHRDDGPLPAQKPAASGPLASGRSRPEDWPGPGPIDLAVHDLPHASSTTEWWYVNGHVVTETGRKLSLFASFFRIAKGRDERTQEVLYAHSCTWAVADPAAQRYVAESRVDKDAPRMGIQRLERGEGAKDGRLQRALREVLDKGKVPHPDVLFGGDVHVAQRRLHLDFDGNTFSKQDDGRYALHLRHAGNAQAARNAWGCDVVLTPKKAPIRHGDDGVVRGVSGEDMFYYFVPRCDLQGTVLLPHGPERIVQGEAWYDHEFGLHAGRTDDKKEGEEIGWNWCGLQFSDGSELTAYALVDEETLTSRGAWAVVIDASGERHGHDDLRFEALESWTSTRTFHTYPTRWRLQVPSAGLDLTLEADFADQEFVTLISKPAFWEGRVQARGTAHGKSLEGVGFVERSGQGSMENLDDFFGAVGKQVRKSVAALIPREPTWEQVRDLMASEQRSQWMDGVDVDQFARTMIAPVREITDRGGKSWRSYAALACCDVVGGDSRKFVQWLAMPELMHVGSLIVDDVQDKSTVRRGGPTTHLVFGEALAINAGTACYFMGQKLLTSEEMSDRDKLRMYDLYFESLRAGHAGQALDLDGLHSYVPGVVESGDGADLERRVLAIHRLKTAAPAASLARMGAVAGGGSEAQVEGVGRFFESVGLAFQIIDDVLNLRGFKGDLKSRGEDIAQGKITLPVAKAMARLPLEQRRWLWRTVAARPQEQPVIAEVIQVLEDCGALQTCEDEARTLVEDAWRALEPLVEDSLPKLMLRAFGWYVLERHY